MPLIPLMLLTFAVVMAVNASHPPHGPRGSGAVHVTSSLGPVR